MKKEASIVFRVNFSKFDDKSSGKSNRVFSLYRQLRKKRLLAQFCRDAFLEKAIRQLGEQEQIYQQQLDSLIKSKGLASIVESLQQKEVQIAQVSSYSSVNQIAVPAPVANPIADFGANQVLALETNAVATPAELPVLAIESPAEPVRNPQEPQEAQSAAPAPECPPANKVDLEKLKGLL